MVFLDDLNKIAGKIERTRNLVVTEEATKTAFVLPFLVALGYDVYNPLEVVPEKDCDISRKGDKVDYEINIDSFPAFIIECKQCDKSLNGFVLQLAKYYVATKAKFAVLTNGVEYRFYADIDRTNLMDAEPFFTFDFSSFSCQDAEKLKIFSKNQFKELNILQFANRATVKDKVQEFLDKEVFACSDIFINYVANSIGCSSCVDDVAKYVKTIIQCKIDFDSSQNIAPLNREENKAYQIVKTALKGYAGENDIKFTSFKSYFTINKWGSVWRWIVRVKRASDKFRVCFPLNGYKSNEWVVLDSIDELEHLRDKIIQSFKIASFEKSRQDAVKQEKPQINRN